MSRNNRSRIHFVLAAVLTAAILAAPLLFGGEFIRYPQVGIIWLGSSIWASIEVKRLRFAEYRVSYPYRPIGTFFFVMLLWFFAFPWFLATWMNVRSGVALRKEEPPIELSALAESLLKQHGHSENET